MVKKTQEKNTLQPLLMLHSLSLQLPCWEHIWNTMTSSIWSKLIQAEPGRAWREYMSNPPIVPKNNIKLYYQTQWDSISWYIWFLNYQMLVLVSDL